MDEKPRPFPESTFDTVLRLPAVAFLRLKLPESASEFHVSIDLDSEFRVSSEQNNKEGE